MPTTQPQFPRCVPAFNVEPKVVMYVRNGPWCRMARQINKYVSLGNTIHGTRLASSRGHDDVVQLQLELRPWERCQSNTNLLYAQPGDQRRGHEARLFSCQRSRSHCRLCGEGRGTSGWDATQTRQIHQTDSRRRRRGPLKDNGATGRLS